MVLTFFKVLLTPRLYAVVLDHAVAAVGARFENLAYRPNGWEDKGQTILTTVRVTSFNLYNHSLRSFFLSLS